MIQKPNSFPPEYPADYSAIYTVFRFLRFNSQFGLKSLLSRECISADAVYMPTVYPPCPSAGIFGNFLPDFTSIIPTEMAITPNSADFNNVFRCEFPSRSTLTGSKPKASSKTTKNKTTELAPMESKTNPIPHRNKRFLCLFESETITVCQNLSRITAAITEPEQPEPAILLPKPRASRDLRASNCYDASVLRDVCQLINRGAPMIK